MGGEILKILMFTKPKKVTFECLKYIYNQNEEILGIVIYNLQKYHDTEFFKFCIDNNIRMYDGDEVYSHIEMLKEQQLDVIYVNTYPKLIRDELIEIVSKGAVNFHSAPLPEYKGVFGFNFAIYNQETEYGVTAHKLSNKFDSGDIIEVDRFPIDSSKITVKELVEKSERRLFELFKKIHMMYKNNDNFQFR